MNSNGTIFLSGHTLSGTVNWDTYTMMIDNDGNLLWENKTGNPRGFDPQYIHDEVWGLKATDDGNIVEQEWETNTKNIQNVMEMTAQTAGEFT